MARNYHEGPDWLPGTVLELLGPVTYHMKVNGQVWKRHIDQLKILLKPQGTSAPLSRASGTRRIALLHTPDTTYVVFILFFVCVFL